MIRVIFLACLTSAGCACFEPFDRDDGPGDRPPPLPREEQLGGRFDREVEDLLGPDRKHDADLRPPFTQTPEPRLPTAPRAEDPSWRNR